VQSPQPEKSKPPVKTESAAHHLVKSVVSSSNPLNRDQMREWYSKHLGLADKGQGVMLPCANTTIHKRNTSRFGLFFFPASTKYFDPALHRS